MRKCEAWHHVCGFEDDMGRDVQAGAAFVGSRELWEDILSVACVASRQDRERERSRPSWSLSQAAKGVRILIATKIIEGGNVSLLRCRRKQ